VVAGIAYDGSAVYRRGAALAPREVRRLSAVMPPVTESGAALAELALHDLGNLYPGPAIADSWEEIAGLFQAVPPSALLTVVGGDHCSAIPVLAAQVRRHPDLAVLWFDAHPDLNDFSRGSRWSCGCALLRALECSGLDPARVVLAGCRDFDLEELAYVDGHGIPMLRIGEVAADPVAAGKRIAAAVGNRPLHISLDIDVLDPAFAPGTEIASAGGLSTRQALALMGAVAARCRLVGLDVMEVSPPLDHADITVLAALKLIFEFWGLTAPGWQPRR